MRRIKKCLMPKCKRQGDEARGLCGACYQAAYRLVKRGDVTWEELVESNLALDTAVGSPVRGPAGVAIQAIRNK